MKNFFYPNFVSLGVFLLIFVLFTGYRLNEDSYKIQETTLAEKNADFLDVSNLFENYNYLIPDLQNQYDSYAELLMNHERHNEALVTAKINQSVHYLAPSFDALDQIIFDGTSHINADSLKTLLEIVAECDRLAGSPFDPERISEGAVQYIDAPAAIDACGQAVLLKNIPRLQHQYARSLHANEQYIEALKWYHKAAAQEYASAQTNLGFMYYYGIGVAKNYEEAFKWFRKAAEQGIALAQAKLHDMYWSGQGVKKNSEEAKKWLRKAGVKGARGLNYLNMMYRREKEKGIMKSYEEVVKRYHKAAENGDASAQTNLGLMYYFGKGVIKNYEKAVKWFRKAAMQDYTSAQNNLGEMYYYGNGVTKNYKEAVKWYRMAAEQGNANAQTNLGWMYESGNGVTKNYKEAVKWYRMAAEQDYANAQNNLGEMYYYGNGVTQNYKEAVKWYLKVAEQGNTTAQTNLGIMYEYGKGVGKDFTTAAYWYEKAANSDVPDRRAQLYLGFLYLDGRGVTKHERWARDWLLLASKSTDESIRAAALKGLNTKETEISGTDVILGLLVGAVILIAIYGGDGSSNSSNNSYDAFRDAQKMHEQRWHEQNRKIIEDAPLWVQ